MPPVSLPLNGGTVIGLRRHGTPASRRPQPGPPPPIFRIADSICIGGTLERIAKPMKRTRRPGDKRTLRRCCRAALDLPGLRGTVRGLNQTVRRIAHARPLEILEEIRPKIGSRRRARRRCSACWPSADGAGRQPAGDEFLARPARAMTAMSPPCEAALPTIIVAVPGEGEHLLEFAAGDHRLWPTSTRPRSGPGSPTTFRAALHRRGRCSATARSRPVHFSIIEDGGFAGFGQGVEWCVVGLDRNWAYNPACKAARP